MYVVCRGHDSSTLILGQIFMVTRPPRITVSSASAPASIFLITFDEMITDKSAATDGELYKVQHLTLALTWSTFRRDGLLDMQPFVMTIHGESRAGECHLK